VVQVTITDKNYIEILDKYSQPGTIVIETANEIDTADLAVYCNHNNRYFVNTVADIWKSTVLEMTNEYKCIDHLLYKIVDRLIKVFEANRQGPTAVLMHGANTGMVNHYLKCAIHDLACYYGLSFEEAGKKVREAYILEKDTLCFRPRFVPNPNVFYNTWNIKEFILESVALCEYPNHGQNTFLHRSMQRDVFMDNLMIKGRMVSHEETYTMAYYMAKEFGNRDCVVQFLYEASPIGIMSRMRFPFGFKYEERTVSQEEVDTGFDLVGTLIVCDDGKNWFTGHQMQQETAIQFAPQSNATAWYVSAGVLSGVRWIQKNPNWGVLFPEFANHSAIVQHFMEFTNPKQHISRPIKQLYISASYPDIDLENLYSTGKRVYDHSLGM